jgi:hypothetical protein
MFKKYGEFTPHFSVRQFTCENRGAPYLVGHVHRVEYRVLDMTCRAPFDDRVVMPQAFGGGLVGVWSPLRLLIDTGRKESDRA